MCGIFSEVHDPWVGILGLALLVEAGPLHYPRPDNGTCPE